MWFFLEGTNLKSGARISSWWKFELFSGVLGGYVIPIVVDPVEVIFFLCKLEVPHDFMTKSDRSKLLKLAIHAYSYKKKLLCRF